MLEYSLFPSDDIPMKCCSKCRAVKPSTSEYFNNDKHRPDFLTSQCRDCRNLYKEVQRQLRKVDDGILEGQRKCLRCEQIFPASQEFFHVNQGYLRKECRKCINAKRKIKHDTEHPKEVLPDGYKRCSRCDKIKPDTLQYFFHQGKGLSIKCKDCRDKYIRQWRNDNPDKYRESVARRAIAKKEHIREVQRKYHETRREYFREKGREYYANHKDRVQVYHQKSYQKHKIRIHEHRKHYKALHSEEFRQANRLYYLTHKDEAIGRGRLRRARSRSVSGSHTAAQIQELLKRQRYCCYYCQKKLEKRSGKHVYNVDHTYPLSRVAGSDIPANDINYLVLTCPHCNKSKNDKYPWEWAQGGRLM